MQAISEPTYPEAHSQYDVLDQRYMGYIDHNVVGQILGCLLAWSHQWKIARV